MEDIYDDSIGKLALCASSAKIAKGLCVKEFGIGEELSFNFFGWQDERLAIVCQLDKQFMQEKHIDRFNRSANLITVLRKYWGVTAITFLAEGFHSFDPVATKDMKLGDAFMNKKLKVSECITLLHSEINPLNGLVDTSLVSLPYEYELGRTIRWKDLVAYTQGSEKILRESLYGVLLETALLKTVSESENITDEQYEWLINVIIENGFHIQEV